MGATARGMKEARCRATYHAGVAGLSLGTHHLFLSSCSCVANGLLMRFCAEVNSNLGAAIRKTIHLGTSRSLNNFFSIAQTQTQSLEVSKVSASFKSEII